MLYVVQHFWLLVSTAPFLVVVGESTSSTRDVTGELVGNAPPSSAPPCSVAAAPFLSTAFSFAEVSHGACMDWPSQVNHGTWTGRETCLFWHDTAVTSLPVYC